MPYLVKIQGILGDVKGWMFALIGIVTAVIVVKHGFEYQSGGAMEKEQAAKDIRKTLVMGGGIFFLAWFAAYVVTKMQ